MPDAPTEPREAFAAAGPGQSARPLAQILLRLFLTATAIGGFLAFVGAFGSDRLPFVDRLEDILPFSWVGSLLGFVCFRWVLRWPWSARHPWAAALTSGAVMTPPMVAIVWVLQSVSSPSGVPLSALPQMSGITLTMCLAMSAMAEFIRSRGATAGVPPQSVASPPKFLTRLPLKLQGAEIWAVEAEDHYLRLHTSKGQDLILMRLADAVAELEGLEGSQVHRSWWVARGAIVGAERGDGRAVLTLTDGSQVPVSRTHARTLRDRGWI